MQLRFFYSDCLPRSLQDGKTVQTYFQSEIGNRHGDIETHPLTI